MAFLNYILTSYRVIWIFLVCCVMAIVALFFFALGKSVDWGHNHLRRIWSSLILYGSFVRVRGVGLEKLDTSAQYIFIVNHKSEWDGYAFTHLIPFQWRGVVRGALITFPVVGKMAARTEQIFIPPQGGMDFLQKAAAPHFAQGRSLLMFPEGKRTQSATLDEFRSGAFVLSVASGVPIVPVAVVEEKPAQQPGAFGRKMGYLTGTVRLAVGEILMPPKMRDTAKATEKMRMQAQDAMLKLIREQTW